MGFNDPATLNEGYEDQLMIMWIADKNGSVKSMTMWNLLFCPVADFLLGTSCLADNFLSLSMPVLYSKFAYDSASRCRRVNIS